MNTEFPQIDHTFRVRYAETDQMGVVHNAVFLVWFEMGRTEYCIALDYPYTKIEADGIILVVAEARVRYKKPAFYDEKLTIRTTITRMKPKVIEFRYEVVRPHNEEVIAEGETTHVSIDRVSKKPCNLPRQVIDKLCKMP